MKPLLTFQMFIIENDGESDVCIFRMKCRHATKSKCNYMLNAALNLLQLQLTDCNLISAMVLVFVPSKSTP